MGWTEVTAWATVSLAIIAFFTLLAIIYVGSFQLRQLRQESHNHIIKNFLETWESDSMVESRRALEEAIRPRKDVGTMMASNERIEREAMNLKKALDKYIKENNPKFYAIIRIANYMETLSYMLKSKEDKQLMKDLMADVIIHYFKRFEPWIRQYREAYPDIFRYFEELYLFCEGRLK